MTIDPDRASVLVVEDEPLILEIVADELNDAGFAVFQAATGEEAITIIQTERSLDLLLTDIRLPGHLDGWSVAEYARRRFSTMPVIYVTGYSSKQGRQVSNSVLIMKPYRPSAVVQAAHGLGVKTTPRF